MGKPIDGAERTVILKVISFFENEKRNGECIIPVDRAIQRACMATGYSKATIMRIKQEARIYIQNNVQEQAKCKCNVESQPAVTDIPIKLKTPGKTRRPSSRKIKLNDRERNTLRDIINSFNKETPTLRQIFALARRDLRFQGGPETLRKLLIKELGFKFHNNSRPRRRNKPLTPVRREVEGEIEEVEREGEVEELEREGEAEGLVDRYHMDL